jgi:hypothetical protein
MSSFTTAVFSAALFASCVIAQSCPIQFDGRIAKDTVLATLDTTASVFNPKFVKGKGRPDSLVLVENINADE